MDVLPHTPVVTLEWVEESIKAKQCKFPIDYSMNSISLRGPPTTSEFKRLNKKMKSFMEMDFIQTRGSNATGSNLISQECNLTSQCIIYLDSGSIGHEIGSILKKLISLTGGLYMDVNNLCVTHILVGSITEN